MNWQIQAWPTPEIFIGRSGQIFRDVVIGGMLLTSFIDDTAIFQSKSDTTTGAMSLTSFIEQNNIPFPRSVSDASTGAMALTNFVEFTPVSESATDSATGAMALTSFVELSGLSRSVSDATTGGMNLSSFTAPGNSFVTNWLAAISSAGGATPSSGTQTAMTNFISALTPTIIAKIEACNLFVPDNLISSLTPIIARSGLSSWTNNNFVSGDLSTAGLAGNGSNKYLYTGILPSNVFVGNNGALSVYLSVNPSTANTDLEAGTVNSGGADAYYIAGTYGGLGSLWHFQNNVTGQGALTIATPPQNTGYFSGNRTSAAYSALYAASSTLPHTVAGFISTNGGGNPTVQIYSHGANNGGGPVLLATHKTLSMLCIHAAFTVGESITFYNAVQAARTSLGGGYV